MVDIIRFSRMTPKGELVVGIETADVEIHG
jgi:hypothetical protein